MLSPFFDFVKIPFTLYDQIFFVLHLSLLISFLSHLTPYYFSKPRSPTFLSLLIPLSLLPSFLLLSFLPLFLSLSSPARSLSPAPSSSPPILSLFHLIISYLPLTLAYLILSLSPIPIRFIILPFPSYHHIFPLIFSSPPHSLYLILFILINTLKHLLLLLTILINPPPSILIPLFLLSFSFFFSLFSRFFFPSNHLITFSSPYSHLLLYFSANSGPKKVLFRPLAKSASIVVNGLKSDSFSPLYRHENVNFQRGLEI